MAGGAGGVLSRTHHRFSHLIRAFRAHHRANAATTLASPAYHSETSLFRPGRGFPAPPPSAGAALSSPEQSSLSPSSAVASSPPGGRSRHHRDPLRPHFMGDCLRDAARSVRPLIESRGGK